MAAIDTGGSNERRSLNREMPLVPFIDFLLCLVSFLLITAVWSQMARIDADAKVPGPAECGIGCKDEKPKRLHVEVKDRRFTLAWKQGSTVIASTDVERKPVLAADGTVTYPDLATKLAEEWRNNGAHRSPGDPQRDQAVLHTQNTLEFGEVIAVVDALSATNRVVRVGQHEESVPAFNVNFAAN
jgi:biopolymer transport protein ExbD